MFLMENAPKSLGENIGCVINTWHMNKGELLVLINCHEQPIISYLHMSHVSIHDTILAKGNGRLVINIEWSLALGISILPHDFAEPGCIFAS